MCGISGIISKSGSPFKNLISFTDIISHRGPDDEGYVFFEHNNSEAICLGGNDTSEKVLFSDIKYKPVDTIQNQKNRSATVSFGHRRLSILDLSAFGHQPMCSADERYWIVYNGEVYNYLELREQLVKTGYSFVSDSDTEVILAAYSEWGAECLHRFVGMWAFAIFDSKTNEVFLARDRFGIKPLYYWFNPSGDFHFGSEIKQFTVCNGWKAEMNSQRVYDFLLHSLTDHTDETMFKGVFHIPAGHYFKSKVDNFAADCAGKIEPIKWYNLPNKSEKPSFKDATLQFENHFKNAVKLHLRSDVPVGSALSGGLDSSAIVCEINNILFEQKKTGLQKTFSSVSKNKKFSEKDWIDIVVNETDVDAHYSYPSTDQLFKNTSKVLWHQDEPYQSQSAFAAYQVFELAKNNEIKVLLNGQGADEYLGGYNQYKSAICYHYLKSLRLDSLIKEVKTENNNFRNLIFGVMSLSIPEIFKRSLLKNFRGSASIKSQINIEKLGALDVHPYQNYAYRLNDIQDITKLNIFSNPLPRYLRWEDRNSMAHSIEARVPFLDHRLVEYAYNLPYHHLHYRGSTKYIMREGLKNILPDKIARRNDKKGYITPEEEWVKSNPEMFRKKIVEVIESTNGIIKHEALDYFDDIISEKRPFDFTYWRIILFHEWIKLFGVNIN